ncbi:hypothetical protein M8C13_06125 [Crossiella sp. SN42]|uniref:hypothetical protein n=1 Tax=Crossiella sp. SN42 TaxID=2944808 RepID=UPI00207CF7BE|nr:hypothetical protein [Crossiella sp. SN42]MCO1575336.1 hypothetical protein [Crossiella sp. SN42]
MPEKRSSAHDQSTGSDELTQQELATALDDWWRRYRRYAGPEEAELDPATAQWLASMAEPKARPRTHQPRRRCRVLVRETTTVTEVALTPLVTTYVVEVSTAIEVQPCLRQ